MPSFEIIKRSLAIAGWLQHGNILHLDGDGFPASGTAGDGAGYANKGSQYYDRTRGTRWVNTGSQASPYWQPISYRQPGIWGYNTDFREAQTTALSDTTATLINAGAGYRLVGDGLARTDGGALQGTVVEGGTPLRMTASATAPGLVGITLPTISGSGQYQPDTHGMGIMEAYITNVSVITNRSIGIGFLGLTADGLVAPITAATTVATLVQDDLALLHMSTDYTAGSGFKLASNKSDEAATMTAQAAGVNLAAAATAQLLRVEVEPVGTAVIMRAFIDKVLVGTIADALDEDEEANPILYILSTSAAISIMDVFRAAFVAGRAVAAS